MAGLVIAVLGLNLAAVAVVYWRGVATGTPRWLAFYTALLLGPFALPLLWNASSPEDAGRARSR